MTPGRCLVLCGLKAEARLARADNALVLAGGGDSQGLAAALAALDPNDFGAVISFGVAGALAPDLRVGDVVLAEGIVSDGTFLPSDTAWAAAWRTRLNAAGHRTIRGTIAGVDRPAMTAGDKRALRTQTGAAAVDMESHLAAGFANAHALPFGAVRVVSDTADHALPPLAARAMKPGGGIAMGAVLSGLARSPGQIPALIATARDAAVAFRVLRRVRAALGADYGLRD